MIAYENLSKLYDIFMEIDYFEWSYFIKDVIDEHFTNNTERLMLLDLGCGTGNLTTRFEKYDVIGIDNSIEMLAIANQKAHDLEQNILFLNQDMRDFEVLDKLDVVISTCDSINYILDETDILKIFNKVSKYLIDGGLFIFDINTEYKYKNILSNNSFSYVDENGAVIWENYFDFDSQINEYFLTIFLKDGEKYIRTEEIHYQKSYSEILIDEYLQKSNLKILKKYDDYTKNKPKNETERLLYIVTKK
ncbi:MAG: class I SAM-dependent methyltransferase [Defluviitaleaceae bacterium]|nr:class I SAM-dependent methyltransferase [Defluviitaleaceae bacterium]